MVYCFYGLYSVLVVTAGLACNRQKDYDPEGYPSNTCAAYWPIVKKLLAA